MPHVLRPCMVTAPLTAAEATAGVRAALAAIEADELACTAAMRHRIVGAALALESLSTSTGQGGQRVAGPDSAWESPVNKSGSPSR